MSDLADIAATVQAREQALDRLHQAVTMTRTNGRTWRQIALVLRTTAQAAQERFGS